MYITHTYIWCFLSKPTWSDNFPRYHLTKSPISSRRKLTSSLLPGVEETPVAVSLGYLQNLNLTEDATHFTGLGGIEQLCLF